MKKMISVITALLLMVLMSGCAGIQPAHDGGPEEIRIGGLKGPTSIGMLKLIEDSGSGAAVNKYDFTLAGTADELTPRLIKGELDIIAIPSNLASMLYNKTDGQVKVIAVNTLGVLYIVEKGGESIKSIADLKGRTVISTGKGTTPEFSLNYILKKNGIAPEDVEIKWMSEASEVSAAMAREKTAVAMLPQPYVTAAMAKTDDLRVCLSLSEEWDRVSGDSRLVTGCAVVRSGFSEQYPEAVKSFLREYSASVGYVNENIGEAAKLAEKYIGIKENVARQAIPECNIVYMDGEEMKSAISGYINALYEEKSESVGGKLPGEDFYYLDE